MHLSVKTKLINIYIHTDFNLSVNTMYINIQRSQSVYQNPVYQYIHIQRSQSVNQNPVYQYIHIQSSQSVSQNLYINICIYRDPNLSVKTLYINIYIYRDPNLSVKTLLSSRESGWQNPDGFLGFHYISQQWLNCLGNCYRHNDPGFPEKQHRQKMKYSMCWYIQKSYITVGWPCITPMFY